jgi:hypothetical protein
VLGACSVQIENSGKEVQVRNFLGEKIVRTVNMFDGVTCSRSTVITMRQLRRRTHPPHARPHPLCTCLLHATTATRFLLSRATATTGAIER